MRSRLTIASSLALALFGCGSAEERVTERESGAYEAPDTRASDAPTDEATEPDTGVAAVPWDAAPPASPGPDEDVEITRKIREKLVAGDEPLSSYAQNIEVSAEQGVVTLRGPVENEREKEVVLSIARSTGGVTHVEDRLEIAKR